MATHPHNNFSDDFTSTSSVTSSRTKNYDNFDKSRETHIETVITNLGKKIEELVKSTSTYCQQSKNNTWNPGLYKDNKQATTKAGEQALDLLRGVREKALIVIGHQRIQTAENKAGLESQSQPETPSVPIARNVR